MHCSLLPQVRDLNDNVPAFGVSEATLTVSESQQRGRLHAALPAAVDRDMRANGVLHYNLSCTPHQNPQSPNPSPSQPPVAEKDKANVQSPFAVEFAPDDRLTPLALRLDAPLDFERVQRYTCTLLAFDANLQRAALPLTMCAALLVLRVHV